MNINNIQYEKLSSNCDSVEIVPGRQQFLVATYELNKNLKDDGMPPSKRDGGLNLFDFDEKGFTKRETIAAPAGVLDIKFLNNETFALPLADGRIQFGSVKENQIVLGESTETRDDIALAVTGNDQRVTCSYSSGYVAQHVKRESGYVFEEGLLAHTFETWAVFDWTSLNGESVRKSMILTGGDDCCLKQIEDDWSSARTVRRFDAGVTAIERHPFNDNQVLVGSYDDNLYVLDRRHFKQEVCSVHIGGGIWRIKQSPFNKNLLAIAGMYAGGFIVDLKCNNEETQSMEIISHFDKHDSMCYGIAWTSPDCVLSCSFYDNALFMWQIGIPDIICDK